jgi:hypothetical protein
MDRQNTKDAYLVKFAGDPFGGTCEVVGFEPVGQKRRTASDLRAFRKRVKKRRAKKGYR